MWALLGVHTIAALRSVLGEVVSVYILDHHASSFERDDLEATMSGIVELEGGLVVWLVQTTETRLRPRLTGFRLYGDAGTVIGHDDEYEVHPGEAERGAAPRTFPYPTAVRSPYAEMLDAFVDAVGGQAGGLTTGVSERRTLAVVEAGYESARTRQPVDLRTRYPGIWTE
jgi:predicted dehydrogenase